ncbi:putative methyltransferase [Mycobacterium tuberculosis]|nr:putative methyltransferase [Mycobacterium tuberculosis]
MTIDTPAREDQTLAATHRAMWALGDYALMAEEVMAPLGPILVRAAAATIAADAAAATGRRGQRGAENHRSECPGAMGLAGGGRGAADPRRHSQPRRLDAHR